MTNVSTGESRIRTNETVQVLAPDADADSDGLSNRREVGNATDPLKADTDEDGLDDGTEVAVVGTNPTDSDTDSDGLADGAETGEYGTDPTDSDTDDDGFPDAKELTTGTNPTDSDTDDDGLWDGTEVDTYETDPTDADTDSDGLEDGREVNVYDSDPTVPDTDRDGLSDGAEVNNHDTDPTDSDTDSDGLADGAEVRVHGTDPTDPDTDGDGQSDHTEVVEGGDPAGETDSVPLIGEWRPTTTDGALVTGLVVLVGLGAIVGHRLIRTRRSDEGNDVEIVSDSVPTVATRDDHEFTTDDERLTDPERILQLLEVHGGRLRQSRIVEQTDWSKAKVSRILSKMADEDTITKIRIGRENLVVRSGEEPEFLEPLDDQ